MVHNKWMLSIDLVGIMAVGALTAPAFALTVNPLDPSLPLNQHAWALCGTGSSVPNVGGTRTSCETLNSVVNPMTLNHVVGVPARGRPICTPGRCARARPRRRFRSRAI